MKPWATHLDHYQLNDVMQLYFVQCFRTNMAQSPQPGLLGYFELLFRSLKNREKSCETEREKYKP